MTTLIPTADRPRKRLTMPGLLLKIESMAVLTISLVLYAHHGFSWLAFLLLFLVPDLAIAVFAIDKRLGSIVYNLIHTYTLPLLIGTIFSIHQGRGFANGHYSLGMQLALIWLAHVAMDRIAGYGLKYLGQYELPALTSLKGWFLHPAL